MVMSGSLDSESRGLIIYMSVKDTPDETLYAECGQVMLFPM